MRLRFPLTVLALVFLIAAQASSAQEANSVRPTKARCVIGLAGIKENTNGRLSVEGNALAFAAGKRHAGVPIASIEKIFVGSEVTDAGGMLGQAAEGAASMAPYDSGALLILLLRQKVDVITVAYGDSAGGLHGAIFVMRKGQGAPFRTDLIARGARDVARTAVTALNRAPLPPPMRQPDTGTGAPVPSPYVNPTGPTIQVEPITAPNVDIPQEFRMAIYEEVVQRLQRSRIYANVYRSGDPQAVDSLKLETVLGEVKQFKEGSQTLRELTFLFGHTKVAMRVSLSQSGGTSLLDQDVVGRVLFFGENLGVANDVAKHTLKILKKNLRRRSGRSSP